MLIISKLNEREKKSLPILYLKIIKQLTTTKQHVVVSEWVSERVHIKLEKNIEFQYFKINRERERESARAKA